MSSVNEAGHHDNGENVSPSKNYDDKKVTVDKPKDKAMARRTSFSMTRPWSSFAENYSSCLSGLRRNSAAQTERNDSPQSFQESRFSSLSRSLDSRQLRNLKMASVSEEKQPSYKVSPLHARPFHQRRWSSPVAFPVVNSVASSSQHRPQDVKYETTSPDLSKNSRDKDNDKTSEMEEIIFSHVHSKPSVPVAVNDQETQGKEGYDKQDMSLSPNINKTMEKASTTFIINSRVKDSVKEKISSKDRDESRCNTDSKCDEVETIKVNSSPQPEATNCVKVEEHVPKRDIYAEIKKNTKWLSSKRFRRRHHTIHTDSRNHIHQNLFTITEQSSTSLDATNKGQNSINETTTGEKLQRRRSKSLDDLTTLTQVAMNKPVFVQQFCSKSLCVQVGRNATRDEQKGKSSTTINKCKEDVGKTVINSMQPVQVNIQTFNYTEQSNPAKPYFTGVICGGQPNADLESANQDSISTPKHTIFTQAKSKWASITISHV